MAPDLSRLKAAILAEAPVNPSERDEDLADYVITLLDGNKSIDQVASELQPVLGDESTARFCDWLESWLASSAASGQGSTDKEADVEAKQKKEETKRLYNAYLKSGFDGDFDAYKVFVGTSWDKKQDVKLKLEAKTWHRVRDGPPEVRLAAPLMADRAPSGAAAAAVAAAAAASARGSAHRGRGVPRGTRGFRARGIGASRGDAIIAMGGAGRGGVAARGVAPRGRGSKNLVWVRDASVPAASSAPAAGEGAIDRAVDPLSESLPKTP